MLARSGMGLCLRRPAALFHDVLAELGQDHSGLRPCCIGIGKELIGGVAGNHIMDFAGVHTDQQTNAPVH